MTFAEPLWIWFAVGVALLAALGLTSHARRRRRLAEFLGGAGAARRLSGGDLGRGPFGRILLLGAAAVALGTAAAGPDWSGPPTEPDAPDRTVLLALDVSGSMQATDADPTRLGRAAEVARGILEELDEERVGLLVFAGKPYPLAPPTRDHAVLEYLLEGVTPTVVSMEDPGTLLSEGLREAGALLAGDGSGAGAARADRSVVLIGDGETGEEEAIPTAVVRELAAERIRVHAVGVGTAEGSDVVLPVGYQRGGRLTDDAGVPVVSRLEETTLRRLARVGGGRYVRADDPEAVRTVSAALGEGIGPERDEGASADVSAAPDRAPFWTRYDPGLWLTAAALFLLLVESLLDLRLPGRERGPASRPVRSRVGAARPLLLGSLAVAGVLVAVFWGLDRRSLERANRLYRAGEVAAAVEVYRLHAEAPRPDAVSSYDLGTALLAFDGSEGDADRAGAERHLRRAAESADPAVARRAHYNLGYRFLLRAESVADPDSALVALEAAVRHYRAALEIEPEDDDAAWNLALAERRLEDLLRRAPGVDPEASGSPDDVEFDDGELVRTEAGDSVARPPPADLPPSEDAGGAEESDGERVAVEGAEEARTGDDPGPLDEDAALRLIRDREEDPEHLVRRLLWVHRPDVAWWDAESYPGGGW